MIVKVLKKKVLQCLQERKVVEIGILKPGTLPHVIVEVMKVVEIGFKIPGNLPQMIAEVVDVGQV